MHPLAALAGLAALRAALPSGEQAQTSAFPSRVYLLRPEDFAHPLKKAEVRQKALERGGRWVIVGDDWTPRAFFPTAEQGRYVLRGAGFRGPFGQGTYSRWER